MLAEIAASLADGLGPSTLIADYERVRCALRMTLDSWVGRDLVLYRTYGSGRDARDWHGRGDMDTDRTVVSVMVAVGPRRRGWKYNRGHENDDDHCCPPTA